MVTRAIRDPACGSYLYSPSAVNELATEPQVARVPRPSVVIVIKIIINTVLHYNGTLMH